MSYPKNPDNIVIKNKYYPNGLTELDIYNYYIDNKKLILKNLGNRNNAFTIIDENSKVIFKRYEKSQLGLLYKLNKNNYDTIITGRTITIHSIMGAAESFGIIDIDSEDLNQTKMAANNIINYFKNKTNYKFDIRFSGGTGFHIYIYFNRLYFIDDIKRILIKELHKGKFDEKYNINKTRGIKVNLDLSSNKRNGAFITTGSLSNSGLISKLISEQELYKFNILDYKIK